MARPSLARSAFAGFCFGALPYGGALGIAHLLYNRIGHLGDALVVLVSMAFLYGAWAAGCVLLAGLAVRLWRRLRTSGSEAPDATLWLGLSGFQGVFWAGFFLYGLTYDQGPFGPLDSRAGMLAWVATIVAATACGALLVSRLVAPPLERLRWTTGRVAGALLLSAGICGAVVGWFAVQPDEPPVTTGVRPAARDSGLDVVLIGLDGATWRVLQPMIDRGELPTFQALQRQGSWGDLTTYPDANSAVIWASIYTGLDRARHRLQDFYTVRLPAMQPPGIYPVHHTFFKELVGLLEPLGLAERRPVQRFSLQQGAPIWEVADAMGVSVGVVDGYLYSQPAPPLSTPDSYVLVYGLDLFGEQLQRDPTGRRRGDLPLFVQPGAAMEELYATAAPHLPRWDFFWQSETLLDLLATRPQPRFVNLYTHEPDAVQHLEWKWYEPQYFLGVDAAEVARRGDAIPAMMRSFDHFLERLLAAVDDNTVVIVASDHGQAPTLLHGSYFTQHRHGPPGVLLMAGGPVKAGQRLDRAHVLDLFPTILQLLGLPLPQDADGRLLEEALSADFLERQPPASVPSYAPFVQRSGDATGVGLEREEIDKLRALGYL